MESLGDFQQTGCILRAQLMLSKFSEALLTSLGPNYGQPPNSFAGWPYITNFGLSMAAKRIQFASFVAPKRSRSSTCCLNARIRPPSGWQWVGVDLQPPPVSNYRRLKLWWSSMIQERVQGNEQLQKRLQKVIYIVWNIWKERCRRVFDNRAMPPNMSIIKEDVRQWHIAWHSASPALE
jgi:hypothetical protein